MRVTFSFLLKIIVIWKLFAYSLFEILQALLWSLVQFFICALLRGEVNWSGTISLFNSVSISKASWS